ncbi:ribosomal RNA-processing protein 8-like isoform X2 [Denticeps clupeoides]|uniref:ribosomal RNA-processing protein 8-like isoform X2 n=1 Tax=Denticeps clupeoides TaxID=299321 RepID=UPI0010A3E5F2|nr:ribosomal RNA-processing protein 8-like isoform X2 [Denticeps clupeoides]XP_028821160.1 ribosomal RNA-processing protein 8-like isoform X2 [Denticeps clupeoides]
MFAEEEWNDAPEAEALTLSVLKGSNVAPLTNAGTGKKSLMRTLQTLGSVPDWSSCTGHDESESDTEVASPNKKKKKRSYKRKRASNMQHEQPGDTATVQEMPNKKQKVTLRPKGSGNPGQETNSCVADHKQDLKMEQKTTKNSADNKLGRKQWKNRMKNKRKCKNKYKPSTAETPKANESLQQNVTLKENAASDVNGKKQCIQSTDDIGKSIQKTESSKKSQKIKNKTKHVTSYTDRDAVFSSKDTLRTVNEQDHIKLDHLNMKSHEVINDQSQPTKMKTSKEKQNQTEKLRQMLKVKIKGCDRFEESNEEATEDKKVEESHETGTPDRSTCLRSKMEKRLEAARFRYINELLYTSTSGEAKRMFKQDPQAFDIYHRGFTSQVQYWPANPVDAIISYIQRKPSHWVVADFGCGDCKIARSVKNKVHSFDLAPTCELVTVCDMAKVPLGDATVDIAVFCLSLMGTNLNDFLLEANRVLVMRGVLKIAEVASRFENVRNFTCALSNLGFKLNSKDTENSHFYIFEFSKVNDAPERAKKSGLVLKPCLYKKR